MKDFKKLISTFSVVSFQEICQGSNRNGFTVLNINYLHVFHQVNPSEHIVSLINGCYQLLSVFATGRNRGHGKYRSDSFFSFF